MKYLCLIYYDEHKLDALSSSEFDALVREAVDYDERMRESGHYVTSNALQPTRTATSLRVQGGHVSVTDGPFAETKEQLCGFIVIAAQDLDDAIRVASADSGGAAGLHRTAAGEGSESLGRHPLS